MTAVELDLGQVKGLIRLAASRQLVQAAKLVVVVVEGLVQLLHFISVLVAVVCDTPRVSSKQVP